MNAFVTHPRLYSVTLSYQTERRLQFIDLTDEVARQLEEARLDHGQALVFSRHTTAGVLINEHEPLLLEDLARTLDRLAAPHEGYRHDDLTVRTVNLVENEPANGHSHCQQLAVGCSVHIPILNGQLALGRWQRVFLVELDEARPREVVVQLWGT